MKNIIWYEKYRPRKISDLVLEENTKKHLAKFIKENDLPHLIFYGGAGGGKTTIAKIIIKECAGSSLILSASGDESGKDTITGVVKQFAAGMRRKKDRPNIVFFDEADGLSKIKESKGAQGALKNYIERYHKNCRFIFALNDYSQLIEPIKSRCMQFKFETLPKTQVFKICKKILSKENIDFEKNDVKKVINKFYPDIRSIINNLQACSISGEFNVSQMLGVKVDFNKLTKLLDKGKINDIRHLWAGIANFTWLYQFLFDKYIIDKENVADAALVVAKWMHRSTYMVDKEICATACIIDVLLEIDEDANLYF